MDLPDPLPVDARSTGPLDADRARCPARRASPTGRWSARRWPTAQHARRRAVADDTEAMVDGLARLGIDVDADWAATPDHRRRAAAGGRRPSVALVDARLSGTTSPLPAPGARPRRRAATGSTAPPQLRARPMGDAVDALRALGVDGRASEGAPGHLPGRGRAAARWPVARCALPGDASSQFLSGLLLAGPAMRPASVDAHHRRWCRGPTST